MELIYLKPWAEKFYKSKQWQKCRQAFFIGKHGICERCNGAGRIVHHKIKLNPMNINNPTIALNHEHLELLCDDCHNKEHGIKPSCADGLIFNEYGDLIQAR